MALTLQAFALTGERGLRISLFECAVALGLSGTATAATDEDYRLVHRRGRAAAKQLAERCARLGLPLLGLNSSPSCSLRHQRALRLLRPLGAAPPQTGNVQLLRLADLATLLRDLGRADTQVKALPAVKLPLNRRRLASLPVVRWQRRVPVVQPAQPLPSVPVSSLVPASFPNTATLRAGAACLSVQLEPLPLSSSLASSLASAPALPHRLVATLPASAPRPVAPRKRPASSSDDDDEEDAAPRRRKQRRKQTRWPVPDWYRSGLPAPFPEPPACPLAGVKRLVAGSLQS